MLKCVKPALTSNPHESGLAGALTRLCEKECLQRISRASYLVTDKG